MTILSVPGESRAAWTSLLYRQPSAPPAAPAGAQAELSRNSGQSSSEAMRAAPRSQAAKGRQQPGPGTQQFVCPTGLQLPRARPGAKIKHSRSASHLKLSRQRNENTSLATRLIFGELICDIGKEGTCTGRTGKERGSWEGGPQRL